MKTTFGKGGLLLLALLLCGQLAWGQAKQYMSLGALASWQESSPGHFVGTDANGVQLEVRFYSPTIVRVRATPHESFEPLPYAVVAGPQKVVVEQSQQGKTKLLRTSALELRMTTDPIRIGFYTLDGHLLNEDEPGFGMTWMGDEATVYKSIQPDEKFIGLGEKVGSLNRRGQGYTHYNVDSYAYSTNTDPIYGSYPFYIGVHGQVSYGLFLNNSYKSHFNFGASNERYSSVMAEGGDMDYFFFGANDVASIIEDYSHMTGRHYMPAKWSLGFQQCRYSYYPDVEVVDVAQTFREKDIPADVMYLDIHYMDAYKVFTWHEERFPDPEGMVKKLKGMGFHTALIIDPGIKIERGYDPYEQGLKKDLFLTYPDGTNYAGEVWPGWCHMPDFTSPKTRKWWGNSFKMLTDIGIEGFWNDMNEPATWGHRFPEHVEFDIDGQGGYTKMGRNIYGMQMARATWEGTKQLLGERPFILTRAGFSGVQRYSAVWTGDNVASDDHMMLGVRLVNSLGLAGVPNAGPDVGGFVGDASPDLFARWVSIGAFTPFFRGHTGVNTRTSEPWSYGEKTEEVARNYIKLRYRLMPYLYSAFHTAHTTGLPVARSLAIDYTHDGRVYDGRFEHQFLFGDNILVAPVKSYESIAKVFLPAGDDWYYWHDETLLKGDQIIYQDTPVEKLPLYVKAGSIVPMQNEVPYLDHATDGVLRLHLFKGDKGSTYHYYEDDGNTYAYEDGKYHQRLIAYDAEANTLTLGAVEGDFDSQFTQVEVVLHGFPATSSVQVDGSSVSVEDSQFELMPPITRFDPIGNEGATNAVGVQRFRCKNSTDELKITL